MTDTNANVIEIFSSIQGEGKYIGCRQIFIRLSDCNLHCAYCDTNFRRVNHCNVETPAGSMNFAQIDNPLNVNQIAEIIRRYIMETPTHSISFTGGEPLLHWKFIREVAAQIRNPGTKIFLETNGTLADNLRKILDVIDIISMDIKLPSVVENVFDKHRDFLTVARHKDLYVKIVISNETTLDEFDAAINLISEVSPQPLLILQPVTPIGTVQAIPATKILALQARASRILHDVRVIPQMHRLIKIL